MIFNKWHDILYLTFSNLSARPEIVHGIFSRAGGNGSGPYARLNIGSNVGDSESNVTRNRAKISQFMGGADPVALAQIHSARVVVVDDDFNYRDASRTPPRADALITAMPDIPLMIQVADCQAVMLFDPVRKVLANVHSGWRGSVSNIIGACIKMMEQRFHTVPADILAGIGPSLGPCCAEFVNYPDEIPESYWIYRHKDFYFDFWAASFDQLRQAGVLPENIESSQICTKCNPHLFFSYRHSNTTGRFAAVIQMR